MSPKYHIHTYGCQMNVTESEEIAGICEVLGLAPAKTYKDADVIILNSCSVRQAAEDKVYGWGKKVKKAGKKVFGIEKGNIPPLTPPNLGGEKQAKGINQNNLDVKISPPSLGGLSAEKAGARGGRNHPIIILTGCMVGSARGKRRRISERELKHRANFVDYFMDQGEYAQQLPTILLREGLVSSRAQHVVPLRESISMLAKRKPGQHAYVKISEGCDNFCTYCVVPYGRGEEISKPKEQILAEARFLVDQGFDHLTLLGQNVNSWGIESAAQKKNIRINSQQKLPFAALLRELHEIDGLKKISFISANPFDFTQDMVETLKLPKIDRYLHIAVQSGSDSVLERMNRRHTIAEFKKLIVSIRQSVPDMRVGTDLIVGFCGESESEFEATLDLVRTVKFDVAYMAMYSVRPGTLAALKSEDDVPSKVKHERYRRLTEAVREVFAN